MHCYVLMQVPAEQRGLDLFPPGVGAIRSKARCVFLASVGCAMNCSKSNTARLPQWPGLLRELLLFICAASAHFKNCGQLAVKTDVPVIFLFL